MSNLERIPSTQNPAPAPWPGLQLYILQLMMTHSSPPQHLYPESSHLQTEPHLFISHTHTNSNLLCNSKMAACGLNSELMHPVASSLLCKLSHSSSLHPGNFTTAPLDLLTSWIPPARNVCRFAAIMDESQDGSCCHDQLPCR